jgi:hypothetical protein
MAAAVFSTYGLPPISLVAHDTALRIGADFRSAAEPDPLPSERDNHILTARTDGYTSAAGGASWAMRDAPA